jgi:citrate lyase beta subunit
LKNYSNSTFLCFDLEDSIQDLDDYAETTRNKQRSRETLEWIVRSNIEKMKNLNIGIRLNQISTDEYKKDIALLFRLQGCLNKLTLFLPKTEKAEDIQAVVKVLHETTMPFTEIVAIIENKMGMQNLPSILSERSDIFHKIAFGHCDYNFDLQHFPFFHQDSASYWEVVDTMLTSVEASGCMYINSPCLRLDDKEYFDAMLKQLIEHRSSKAIGQIVLTHKQADWCRSFSEADIQNTPSLCLVHENHTIEYFNNADSSPVDYAKRLIADYETNRNGKSFSVAGMKRVLISPHEYIAARRYLHYE